MELELLASHVQMTYVKDVFKAGSACNVHLNSSHRETDAFLFVETVQLLETSNAMTET